MGAETHFLPAAPALCLAVPLRVTLNKWSAESNKGCPICNPSIVLASLLFFSHFILQNSFNEITFTHVQPVAFFFCLAEVSLSLFLSCLFHFVLHLSISYFCFYLSVFSLLFCPVPGPHPGKQLQPLQRYILSWLSSCVCLCFSPFFFLDERSSFENS